MHIKTWSITIALALAMTATAAAQAPQSLVLEFVDGDNLDIVYPDTTSYSYSSGSIVEGDAVPVGSTVKTGAGTSVELRIKPNGTLIKLAKMTTFRVEGLATPQKDQNGFTLVAGKIRAVAAKGSQYSIYTANTVAGVRGTDFSMSFEEGAKALLLVAKGKVEFGRREGDAIAGAIMVGAGQFADFFKGLAAAPFTPQMLAQEYEGLDIPLERMPVQADDPVAEPVAEPADEPESKAEDAAEGSGGEIAEWLRDLLGMEIGSITINGVTWAKAVIQPTFKVGKLKAGLYLPIIYSDNLFDSSSWYHPSGNDEWSFGTDQNWSADPLNAVADAATDIALKIKFIEYGQPLVDPFFFKVGNLDSFTLGHGLIMRNYANDADFPSIRRIGLNLGIDQGSWGFEALTNDLTDNQILGTRLYVRPIPDFKLAIGVSAVADLKPAGDLDQATADSFGDPIFIAGGVDLDLPIIQSGIFGIRFFADGAAMAPYVRKAFTLGTFDSSSGFRYDMVFADGTIKNWGASTGFIGNVLFIDWRLEYRYFTGAFTPTFFDSSYERRRAGLVEEWAGYLSGATPIDQSPSVMGVYGEGGVSILKDKLSLSLGYFWPWSADAESLDELLSTSDDYFKASLVILKGLIPVVDVSGSISYERKGLARSIADGSLDQLFDENTTFSGEVVFPVPKAPNLDLAFIFSTTLKRTPDGEVVYVGTKPKMVPSVTLETRLHF